MSIERQGQRTPVAWIFEDGLPPDYPYDAMFPYSRLFHAVRKFPVYAPAAPQGQTVPDQWRDAVIEECAMVCEQEARSDSCRQDRTDYVAKDCARLIRALRAEGKQGQTVPDQGAAASPASAEPNTTTGET